MKKIIKYVWQRPFFIVMIACDLFIGLTLLAMFFILAAPGPILS